MIGHQKILHLLKTKNGLMVFMLDFTLDLHLILLELVWDISYRKLMMVKHGKSLQAR